MILIADSGSTKCDWALIDETRDTRVATEGINPFFCDAKRMEAIIGGKLLKKIDATDVNKVLFFGAGCRDDKKQFVYDSLSTYFPGSDIEVSTDLEAAAIALYGNRSGIAAILGTGAIACMYDGKSVVRSIAPLGYILGDEGSGAVLGKKFLGDCFKTQVPPKLQQSFLKKYPMTVAELIDRVYRQPQANTFLASFVPFLAANIAEAYVYNLVFDSFVEFFERNIMQCADSREYEVSFCGSVAYHFADILEVVTYEMGYNFGHIQKAPLDGLIRHFRQTNYK